MHAYENLVCILDVPAVRFVRNLVCIADHTPAQVHYYTDYLFQLQSKVLLKPSSWFLMNFQTAEDTARCKIFSLCWLRVQDCKLEAAKFHCML